MGKFRLKNETLGRVRFSSAILAIQGRKDKSGRDRKRVRNPNTESVDQAIVENVLRNLDFFAVAQEKVVAILNPSVDCISTQSGRNDCEGEKVQNAERDDETAQSFFGL